MMGGAVMTRQRLFRGRLRRSGFSLMDALAMMLLIGLLMSLSAVVLNRALVAHSHTLSSFYQMQNLQSAADSFLADSHSAVGIEISESLKLKLSRGRHIDYSVKSGLLIRTRSHDGTVEGIEQWSLPEGAHATWSVQYRGHIPLVSCQLRFDTTNPKVTSATGESTLLGNALTISPIFRSMRPIKWVARLPLISDLKDATSQTHEPKSRGSNDA